MGETNLANDVVVVVDTVLTETVTIANEEQLEEFIKYQIVGLHYKSFPMTVP